jgi:hypothetical protein
MVPSSTMASSLGFGRAISSTAADKWPVEVTALRAVSRRAEEQCYRPLRRTPSLKQQFQRINLAKRGSCVVDLQHTSEIPFGHAESDQNLGKGRRTDVAWQSSRARGVARPAWNHCPGYVQPV